MKSKRGAKKEKAEETVYPEWEAPQRIKEEKKGTLRIAVPLVPSLKEMKEIEMETQCIPLIDTTTRNYIPRIDYTVFIEGDKEISNSLI